MKKDMHVILTGAYGLIGYNFTKFFDRMPHITLTRIKCDILPEDCEPADVIIHAAGYGQPLKFTEDKIKTIEINTKTTIELFRFLKPGGKFLFVSTSEVYSGALSPNIESILGTTTPDHPRACYIEGKRCGEAICHAFIDKGFDVKIARLALAYGPGTKIGDTRVLNQFIEQSFSGEIKLKDHGEALRTYIYVEDAVELMWKIALHGRDVVYNVGGFSTLTIAELAEEIARLTGAKVTYPEHDNGLQDAPPDVRLSVDKTLRELPIPLTPLDKGLIKTINYQRNLYFNPNEYY